MFLIVNRNKPWISIGFRGGEGVPSLPTIWISTSSIIPPQRTSLYAPVVVVSSSPIHTNLVNSNVVGIERRIPTPVTKSMSKYQVSRFFVCPLRSRWPIFGKHHISYVQDGFWAILLLNICLWIIFAFLYIQMKVLFKKNLNFCLILNTL